MLSKIKKRDGAIVDFQKEKIATAIFRAAEAVGGKDKKIADELAEKVVIYLEELGFSTKKIPTVEDVQDAVEKTLIENQHAKTAKAYIIYRLEHKKIREVKSMMGVKDDIKLTVNAIKVLEKRYLKKDEVGRVTETPKEMLLRVAHNITSAEKNYGTPKHEIEELENKFFEMMINLEFMPNSPTLMNAGRELQQLAACFVLPVEDDMAGIFDAIKNAALIHQSGGGTGFSFSRLRPRGDIVRSTMGVASGPISFMKVFNAATEVIKQGGTRRGANMGVLRVDHPDILDFIVAKERTDALNNFNISVAITDKFMKAAKEDKQYDLVHPKNKLPVKSLDAKRVFNLICTMAWKNGEPGVIFIDQMNKSNPTPLLGEIESTNPCVSGNTFVSTEKGLVKIKEIANGSNILTASNVPIVSGNQILLQKEAQLQKALAVFKTGIKETYKLKTKSGYEINATADHKILTENGWKQLGDLTENDSIYVQKNYQTRDINFEFIYDCVESITPNGLEEVYDLIEPNTRSFIGNGIVVHNCGEVPLLPFESCNLASINLSKLVKNGEVDYNKLKEITHLATRFLDNVIDMNKYPLEKIKETVLKTRKMGLGVMGFADMLIQLGIPYNSEEAVKTAERVMKFIYDESIKASEELANKRGLFPAYNGSLWEKKGLKVRNATLTTIAPTGTISIIAGASSGIEPLFAISFLRVVMDGTELLEINPYFEAELKKRGLYSEELVKEVARQGTVQHMAIIPDDMKKLFVTAHDITPEYHVKIQAAFQKYTDNAVSKTVNFPTGATVDDIENVFNLAYDLGCKGITIYRDRSREEQVLNIDLHGVAKDESSDKLKGKIKKTEEGMHVSAEYSGGCPTCNV